jgi:cytochrome oxidase Cu insertion factor (SCO1/SenC/PrrC family)
MNNKGSYQWLLIFVFIAMLVQSSYAETAVNNIANDSRASKTKVANNKESIGGDFTLTDHNGKLFSLKSQRGKLVLIFFGYTYCPDVCPTELSTLSRVLKSLDKDVDKVTALFITVDPERDTAEKLKSYVHYYSSHLVGLTGSKESIDKVTKAYHVQYKIHPHKATNKFYIVDHSASLYVINQQGKLDKIIPFGLPIEHIQNVIKKVLSSMK